MNSYLLTHVYYGKKRNTGVTFWDPHSGLPIKSLPFENLSDKCLSVTSDGYIIANADNKPLIQSFDLNRPSDPIKKFTLNHYVTCILPDEANCFLYFASKSDILIYHVSSGTICGKFSNSHSATIKKMILIQPTLSMPKLLISCDINGMIACWNLGSSIFKNSTSLNGTSNIKPIWFSVHVSSDLPHLQCFNSVLFIGSSNVLKLLDVKTGRIIRTINIESEITSLHIIDDLGRLFMGSNNGRLFHCMIPKDIQKDEFKLETRTCFLSSNENFDKNISSIQSIPESSLLAVACTGGQIDILKNDALLTKLQSFSSIQNEYKSTAEVKPSLREMIILPCPNWSNVDKKAEISRITIALQRKDFDDLSCLYSRTRSPLLPTESSSLLHSHDVFSDLFFLNIQDQKMAMERQNQYSDIKPTSNNFPKQNNPNRISELERENFELKEKISCLESYM